MRTSTNDAPRSFIRESGAAALPMVIGLLVLVTLMGGAALKMFSVESKQSLGEASASRLQHLSRMGLESSFSLLRSMGAITNLQTSVSSVGYGPDSLTREVTNCNFFPRTDDSFLPSGEDSGLVSQGYVTCANASVNHPDLSPSQSTQDNLVPSSDTNYRSVFPWVRYRSKEIMDAQYGRDEDIQTQINQCGLSSQFNSSSGNSGVPLQRYRYAQDFDGLGDSWLDLGATNMNTFANGLTLEAWVWMSEADVGREWQRIFDIARGRGDSNIVMGYNQGNVSIHMFGPGFNFFQLNPTITVPYNNQNVNDLWYYIAAVIDPASAPNPQVRVYTKCQRTGSSQDPGSQGCGSDGEVISGAGWDGLYRRRAQSIDWYPELDQNVDRKTWVGKSFWPDYDFKGKMRDLRVWDRALSESELNQPITVNFTADTRQSTLISNSARNESMRISPLYKFGNDRLLYITVKETETAYKNTWRLVSCAWNHKTLQRQSQSLRFRVLGTRRPEAIEYLPY